MKNHLIKSLFLKSKAIFALSFLCISTTLSSSYAQVQISPISTIKIDSEISAKAKYTISGMVLSKQKYSSDKESDWSEYDVAAGWNKMSDPDIVDQLTITQSGRWYHWRYEKALKGITTQEIITSSANIHLISANKEVEKKIKKLSKWDRFKASGYLVDIKTSSGWKWQSSMSTTDSGAGACELFYVTSIEIL